MNHLIQILIILFLFFSCQRNGSKQEEIISDVSDTTAATFKNPLPVAIGDPYVLYDSDGRYYMYGTGGGAKDGFPAFSSEDLVNWKHEGQIYYGNNEETWGIDHFWAPEVYKRNGKYYMFYSAQWEENPTQELENFRIGVAVANNPIGPFKDLYNKPVFDPGYPILDANVFFDQDG
ncbi:MAG: family 43 glycosylhydrolase, partial [Bacteroidota bacterium]|nr:family 43 glycosylhydrolase [Bacteroidota bacterium]